MVRINVSLAAFILLHTSISTTAYFGAEDIPIKREKMVKAIEADMANTAHMTGIYKISPKVHMAMGSVERHLFVPRKLQHMAYENRPCQ